MIIPSLNDKDPLQNTQAHSVHISLEMNRITLNRESDGLN